jgi:hypothetical protein
MFFLSLLDAATIVDDGNLGPDSISLIASYDAALLSVNQELQTLPPVADLSAELIKQIEAAGLTDQSLALLSQIAEMQKQIDALNASPNLRPPSVSDVSGLGTMAIQNADAVAITGGTINNTVIGGTTPAAGTFTTLTGGGGSANFFQTQGAATTKAVEAKALGSDTNIAFVIDSKGTGAIDLAAGSSGVNISNGGTVTAITRTASGTTYTSAPIVAISAPTTAGGVQATATCTLGFTNPVITSGGTGYTVSDVLSITGGTSTTTAQLTVTSVSGGVITGVSILNAGVYSVAPSNPASVTGGTGSSATFTLDWVVRTTFTITNAGSGYVEQPTVSFSGGGGSGAAAYATVGSGTIIRSLGSTLDLSTPSGIGLRVFDSLGSGTNYWSAGSGYTSPYLWARGSTNTNGFFTSNGTGFLSLQTNGGSNEQLRVAHTASAVNYVQVTGAATTASPSISVQGSDTNLNLNLQVKGTGAVSLAQNRTNYISAFGAGTGASPSFLSQGGDTNIDLTLTPKGTGNVRFGTYTGTISAITGYIEIKDSGGTVRRLAVVA